MVTMTREDESTSPINHKIVNIVSKFDKQDKILSIKNW
jgi:hypothetical protein